MQISLNLVENVFRRTSQHDGTGLGVLALCEEGEVFVTDLGDFEQTALGTDVGGNGGKDRVDNSCTCRTCNTVVICLANAADSGDVGLDKVVLREVWSKLANA